MIVGFCIYAGLEVAEPIMTTGDPGWKWVGFDSG